MHFLAESIGKKSHEKTRYEEIFADGRFEKEEIVD